MLTLPSEPAEISAAYHSIDFTKIPAATVAVSGGGDSMALMLSLHSYLRATNHNTILTAVTVDHGLRDGSAEEAKRVGEWCSALGIKHVVKCWRAEKPKSGLQAAAREARYELLAEAAHEAGAPIVLTGHNLDDQLETLFMRAPRSGGTGLGMAGIQKATLYQKSVWFVRPLLEVSRFALRDYLKSKDQPWVDDPSNDNVDFERVAVRQAGIDALQAATLLTRRNAALKQRTAEMNGGAAILAGSVLHVEQSHMKLKREDLHETVLQLALCYIGQQPHFVSDQAIKKAIEFCANGKNGKRFTIHGCLLEVVGDQLKIVPEARRSNEGQFGFDYLIQQSDLALANAFMIQLGRQALPECPIK